MNFRCKRCRITAHCNVAGLCALCQQEGLFDAPRAGDARRSDPVTSKKAAGANLTIRQGQKRDILRRLAEVGVVTSHDVADVCAGQNGTAASRLKELKDLGLIVQCGFEYGPNQRGGTPRFRYRLTEAGLRDAALLGVAS